MKWIPSQDHWRKVIGPYLGPNPREKALRFTAALRVAYFFAATSTILFIYKKRKEYEAKLELESGRPAFLETDPAYRRMQYRASRAGLVYKYSENGVLKEVEFDKDKYYQALEQETLEKAKEAQRKAVEEGRELPPDAIKLV